jgi:peptidyl-tRNA hydrolase, PTH1 family
MFLIVGLGNPGAKYLLTRHNIGFMALDRYFESAGGKPVWKEDKKALICRAKIESQDVLFVKPQTYMNLSGEAVRPIMDFYKIDLDHVLVLHDELDIGYGAIKIQRNRGPGGHNGLKSLNEHFGTQDYTRLKLGVGKPPDNRWDIANWVLSNFFEEEAANLSEFLDQAGDAIESFVINGYDKTATNFTRGSFVEQAAAESLAKEKAAKKEAYLKAAAEKAAAEKDQAEKESKS